MATVCVLGLPMAGKSKLMEDIQKHLPDTKFVEDKAIVQSLMAFHSGAFKEAQEARKGHAPADLYLFLDIDPRVITKRLRLYAEVSLSGTGYMKVLHKVRHDLRRMVDEPKNKMVSVSDKEGLTLPQIAELIKVWIDRERLS